MVFSPFNLVWTRFLSLNFKFCYFGRNNQTIACFHKVLRSTKNLKRATGHLSPPTDNVRGLKSLLLWWETCIFVHLMPNKCSCHLFLFYFSLFCFLKEAVRVRTNKANFGLSRIALIFSVEDNYPIPWRNITFIWTNSIFSLYYKKIFSVT